MTKKQISEQINKMLCTVGWHSWIEMPESNNNPVYNKCKYCGKRWDDV